jgi:hypothetical protein
MHIYTFKERLTEMNVKVEVIADFVSCDPSQSNKEEFRALEDVRENGFCPVTNDANPRCFCIRPLNEYSSETAG